MDYREQAEKISKLLAKINQNIHRETAKHIERYGFTVPQILLLRLLTEERGLSVSEVSKRMALSNSTVSGILDRLEKEGYLRRQRDAKDRRVVYVMLTEKSCRLKQELPIFSPDYFADWIKDLKPEEVEQVISSLSLLATRMH